MTAYQDACESTCLIISNSIWKVCCMIFPQFHGSPRWEPGADTPPGPVTPTDAPAPNEPEPEAPVGAVEAEPAKAAALMLPPPPPVPPQNGCAADAATEPKASDPKPCPSKPSEPKPPQPPARRAEGKG